MSTPSSQALEVKSQEEKQVVIATREAALQFIIGQFEGSVQAQFKALAVKARAAKEKLAQQKQAETITLLEQLRSQLEAVLAQETEASEQRARYDTVYQSLRLLTRFWPANFGYVPDKDEAPATAGLPTCPICLCGICDGTEMITSHNYEFHTACLVSALANKPQINPMTLLRFSTRDMQTIRERAREKGFTVAASVAVAPAAVPNVNRRLPSAFKYMMGFFLLSLLGGILGALGVFLAPVICGVGLFGFLGSMAYFFYQLKRDRLAQQLPRGLTPEELALAQAIELSLRPENNPQPVLRNREMDFLHSPGHLRDAPPVQRPGPGRVVIHLPAAACPPSPAAPVSEAESKPSSEVPGYSHFSHRPRHGG